MILHLEKSALENQWNKNWARAVVATTYISRGKKSLSTVATVGEGAPFPGPTHPEQVRDGKEVFLAGNTWDGFITATAVLAVTFQGCVELPS